LCDSKSGGGGSELLDESVSLFLASLKVMTLIQSRVQQPGASSYECRGLVGDEVSWLRKLIASSNPFHGNLKPGSSIKEPVIIKYPTPHLTLQFWWQRLAASYFMLLAKVQLLDSSFVFQTFLNNALTFISQGHTNKFTDLTPRFVGNLLG
jgi:hypothetical protein